ncbi:hypothetical protein B0A48_01773 [Cryoendolithus antarcticus]|uniref:FAD/NAD(P)-binding domain-containing protein n=1 Tax=Cryoendolithus antarcticus TaxID=1507870 RepID=A0A1V8TQF7_9PEZI|nr:hypothetical protein B0A48_01773 [Cryoendolithus antarcticus]
MAPTVVIIGSGWAGYTVARSIDATKYDVTVISPEPNTPITPLLASAACGHFSLALAEEPIRRKQSKVRYRKASVERIDLDGRMCHCESSCDGGSKAGFEIAYDYLVLAPGCVANTFNTPGAPEHAFFVKNVRDAAAIRARIFDQFEAASLPNVSVEECKGLLHFVIVGGGPTGVELAAELYDLLKDDLISMYPEVAKYATVAIHDVAPGILSPFDEKLKEHAMASFKHREVAIKTGSHIEKVGRSSMHTKEDGEIPCGMVVWATGNKHCALVDSLELSKAEGLPRLLTDDCLRPLDTHGSPIGHVFAIGDAADVKDGSLPTTAEVATQKGEHVAKMLNTDQRLPFQYKQQAMIAYIGDQDGVIAGREDWTGASAWFAWRRKNLQWARGWRTKVILVMTWCLNAVYGKEVARKR